MHSSKLSHNPRPYSKIGRPFVCGPLRAYGAFTFVLSPPSSSRLAAQGRRTKVSGFRRRTHQKRSKLGRSGCLRGSGAEGVKNWMVSAADSSESSVL